MKAVSAADLGREDAGLDLHHRDGARRLEFQAVADQVEQQLAHLHRIGFDRRQVADFHLRAALLDAHFQVAQHFLGSRRQIYPNKRLGAADHPRERQQIINEPAHAGRRALHPLQVIRASAAMAPSHLVLSRSPKAWILRSGSCRSWEATKANCSSSAFERASSAAFCARVPSARLRSVMSLKTSTAPTTCPFSLMGVLTNSTGKAVPSLR